MWNIVWCPVLIFKLVRCYRRPRFDSYYINFNFAHKTGSYCVCVERITLCNCLRSSSSSSCSSARNIEEFGAKIILQTIEQLTQYTILEIHFRSLEYTAVIRLRKSLSKFSFLSSRYKAIIVCWCKQPTSNSFQTCLYCIYLLKLSDRLIITFLTNV